MSIRDFEKSALVRTLPAPVLHDALAKHVGQFPPEGVVKCAYNIYRDGSTGLEFADPMEPGDTNFYKWLGAFPWYYPTTRWEFRNVGELATVLATERGSASIVDVGCGSGAFLGGLQNVNGLQALGIEPSTSACKICESLGIETYNGLTTDFLRTPDQRRRFDVVSSFHTLEHVPDPVSFVRELVELAKGDGVVCISTPLSPMYFESVWFDVLNHPPHHLTRWSLSAYRALATELGLSIRFEFPPAESWARQLWFTVSLVAFGPASKASRSARLLSVAGHPLRTLSLAWRLIRVRRSVPESRWPSVLVILRKPRGVDT